MERMTPEADYMKMPKVEIGEPLGHGHGQISNGNFTASQTQELAEIIAERYLVAVDPKAPGCCIDGRCAAHTMADTAPEPRPSVSGGPLFSAFGAAEMVDGFYGSKSSPDLFERMKEVKAILEAGGIVLGGHVTDAAVANGFVNPMTGSPQTGCGLNDEFEVVMNMPADEKDFVDAVTEALLRDAYNSDFAVYRSKADIENRIKDYDPKKALDTLIGEKGETPNFEGVEVLAGNHGERFPIFNYIKDTTVDRDRLVKETGEQVFVIDMWYIDKIADAMAFGRPDAVEMREKLRHAMVAFQVATYSTLCDGSHIPAFIEAQEVAAPVSV